MIYTSTDASFGWHINGAATAIMSLNTTALYVVGITVSSSDKRLKFNEKPLVNALDLIHMLEPVEYDQTHDLTE